MKERPILFNAEMVRAILSGRKTQTRRAMKVHPDEDGLSLLLPSSKWLDTSEREYNCPFGNVGDQLWVRETFSKLDEFEFFDPAVPELVPDYWYWADGNPTWGNWTRPKPSIHMPRAASRINLLITGVRVERLNDISEEDARSEGAPTECSVIGDKHFLGFRTLWKSIYGDESWQENPWVWVIEFKQIGGEL